LIAFLSALIGGLLTLLARVIGVL